jgi:hypothetical protein
LIITHIGEYHIDGSIEFIRENVMADNPKIIEVKEIWHNSYRHMQFDKEKLIKISGFEKRQLEEITLASSEIKRNEICEETQISARQGSKLAGYLYGLKESGDLEQ